MPVKKYGLVLLNPVTSKNEKYLGSHLASAELIRAVTRGGRFSNAYHLLALREERFDGQKTRYDSNDAKIKGLVSNLDTNDRRLI